MDHIILKMGNIQVKKAKKENKVWSRQILNIWESANKIVLSYDVKGITITEKLHQATLFCIY